MIVFSHKHDKFFDIIYQFKFFQTQHFGKWICLHHHKASFLLTLTEVLSNSENPSPLLPVSDMSGKTRDDGTSPE